MGGLSGLPNLGRPLGGVGPNCDAIKAVRMIAGIVIAKNNIYFFLISKRGAV